MATGNNIKIITILQEENSNRLEQLLKKNSADCQVIKTDFVHLIRQSQLHNPDIIITEEVFLQGDEAADCLNELRVSSNKPVIIWSAGINEKIIAAVFNSSYVYFVKQSDDGKVLMETILKLKPGILTH